MKDAAEATATNKDMFFDLFNKLVKQPIIKNPQLLRKSGWKK